MRAEKFRHLQNIQTIRVICPDLDQRHPPADCIFLVQTLYGLHHRHFLQLFDHLLNEIFIAVYNNRDAGIPFFLRHANCETVDIEFASGKHTYNPDQHTSLIFHKHRQDMFHPAIPLVFHTKTS